LKKTFQIKAKLLYNKRVKKDYLHCVLEAPKIARCAFPGQFVNIKITDSLEPLLRRPFSIHRIRGKGIEIIYEILGKGTEILAQRKSGEYLDVVGPLGHGFDYRLPITPACPAGRDYRLPILIAGGMGVAPLVFLAEKIKKDRPLVLIGAKTEEQILCEKEFKDLGYDVKISTDDGSKGFKGKVTGLLNNLLSTINYGLSTIYACGPKPMLKEIAIISKKYNIPAQISLEEHMACGIGACLGCVVNTREGFKRVCKEGPVFNADEIVW